MNPFFGSIFWLLVTLGVLVTFHEFGHYWVARRCGVKVLRFSVGFGSPLWKRTGKDGTEYWISAIPLGGYVKMLDAREGEVDPALKDQEFTGKPIWKRIAIVAAGPAFNLIFTVAAFWVMFMLGKPDIAPLITAAPQTMAAQAGIRDGDRVLAVDGKPMETFSDTMEAIANGLLGREPLPLTVRDPDGTQRNLTLPLDKLPAGQDIGQYMDKLGIEPAELPPIVGKVTPGLPAAAGGMQAGDRILSVNGKPVAKWSNFTEMVHATAAQSPALAVVVDRAGKTVPLTVTAVFASQQGMPKNWIIGVEGKAREPVMQHFGPVRAFSESLKSTWDRAATTLNMIGKLISGQASTKNLSGVVGIAQVANASASLGLTRFLEFLGLVSLSLAILNLLPIPVLDGGHLLYYLIELVKGSPVSERVVIAGQYVGLALILTMMGLAFYNDIHRIILPS
ncbi:RIP metalloprotease RseP [Dyella sp.]|uniref:RIP metalloprotease RseP n=1 Tax=Dyella sp. TaxID=1869338 RepID=UPI002ED18153